MVSRATQEIRRHVPPPFRQRRALFLVYALIAVALGALVALAAPHLPPLVLGGALALVSLVIGYLFLRRGRRSHWRDVMPCYLSVQDRDLRIIETNALFRRSFGERIEEHCHKVYKKRDTPCPNCPVLKTFEDGKDHTSEEEVLTGQGEKELFVVTSTPLFDNAGKVVAVAEMSTNISEVKTLQKELQKSRQHYQRLFDIVPCYISIQDREFKIVESNDLFRRDFGSCSGIHCYRAYKKGEKICADCPVEKTFSDGAVHSSEETVLTANGRPANMIVYSMPIRDEAGEINAVMEVSTNITEVKRLQQELALMGLAVAGMAHRIKNILMGLEGGMFVFNTAREMDDPDDEKEGWEMVERNVAKISRLVKDLLYCSKARTPKLVDDVVPAQIIREVYELYQPKATQDGIAFDLDLREEDCRGRFDAEGLHNLVSNLVANALDACRFDAREGHRDHRIELRCYREQNNAAVIEVSDNGPGIPEDLHDQVFNGFFSTKGTEGTGLGLLVVQKIADEHGGDVSFSSSSGQGTTFRVELPIVAV